MAGGKYYYCVSLQATGCQFNIVCHDLYTKPTCPGPTWKPLTTCEGDYLRFHSADLQVEVELHQSPYNCVLSLTYFSFRSPLSLSSLIKDSAGGKMSTLLLVSRTPCLSSSNQMPDTKPKDSIVPSLVKDLISLNSLPGFPLQRKRKKLRIMMMIMKTTWMRIITTRNTN